jgi:methionyl-tRNA formyltransferase
MRIVFAGTPAPAVPSRALAASAHEVVGVVTRADAPIGRKRVLTPSPVAQAAGSSVCRSSRRTASTPPPRRRSLPSAPISA